MVRSGAACSQAQYWLSWRRCHDANHTHTAGAINRFHNAGAAKRFNAMSKVVSLVQRVQIASPCPAKWEDMVGDDRSRFCSHCKLNVYNLAAMTEAQGEALIIEKEGKLCARIYRRYDGTILTKDCPRGLRAARKRAAWLALRAAAVLAFLVVSVYQAIAGRNQAAINGVEREPSPSSYLRARIAVQRWIAAQPPPQQRQLAGDVAPMPMPVAPSPPAPVKTGG